MIRDSRLQRVLLSGQVFSPDPLQLAVLVICLLLNTTIVYSQTGSGGNQHHDPQPICGNNIVESGEECDDGNTVEYDGCRNNCKFGPLAPEDEVLPDSNTQPEVRTSAPVGDTPLPPDEDDETGPPALPGEDENSKGGGQRTQSCVDPEALVAWINQQAEQDLVRSHFQLGGVYMQSCVTGRTCLVLAPGMHPDIAGALGGPGRDFGDDALAVLAWVPYLGDIIEGERLGSDIYSNGLNAGNGFESGVFVLATVSPLPGPVDRFLGRTMSAAGRTVRRLCKSADEIVDDIPVTRGGNTPTPDGSGNRSSSAGDSSGSYSDWEGEMAYSKNPGSGGECDDRTQALIDQIKARGYKVNQSKQAIGVLDGHQASAMYGFKDKTIYLRPQTTNYPEVMHEYVHAVQDKTGTKTKAWWQNYCLRFDDREMAAIEIHNLDFMLRHRKMLGLDELDLMWVRDYAEHFGEAGIVSRIEDIMFR